MSGKKSNFITRSYQRSQVKKNTDKAIAAAKGKTGGVRRGFSAAGRELWRGNPKGAILTLVRRAAVGAVKLIVTKVILTKAALVAVLLMMIMLLFQMCMAIFAPMFAGIGFVNDEDISHVTRTYSGWEVDMQMFIEDNNIRIMFPPPPEITGQRVVIGVVVYPEHPYMPPPPFYEYRFQTGVIRHDPMELVSYLTAAHGDRLDPTSPNALTRDELNNILSSSTLRDLSLAVKHTLIGMCKHNLETKYANFDVPSVLRGMKATVKPIRDSEQIKGQASVQIGNALNINNVVVTNKNEVVLPVRTNKDAETKQSPVVVVLDESVKKQMADTVLNAYNKEVPWDKSVNANDKAVNQPEKSTSKKQSYSIEV